MISEDESVVLVFNGEIYNFQKLRKELESKGHKFRSSTDTEVLLRLYIELRKNKQSFDSLLKKLDGIFAFAIWDEQEHCLWVARDAVGVKPLYFSDKNDGFAFASEMKALIPLLYCLFDLPEGINRYLNFLGARAPYPCK